MSWKVRKYSVALVLSFMLSLLVFTSGAFAQSTNDRMVNGVGVVTAPLWHQAQQNTGITRSLGEGGGFIGATRVVRVTRAIRAVKLTRVVKVVRAVRLVRVTQLQKIAVGSRVGGCSSCGPENHFPPRGLC